MHAQRGMIITSSSTHESITAALGDRAVYNTQAGFAELATAIEILSTDSHAALISEKARYRCPHTSEGDLIFICNRCAPPNHIIIRGCTNPKCIDYFERRGLRHDPNHQLNQQAAVVGSPKVKPTLAPRKTSMVIIEDDDEDINSDRSFRDDLAGDITTWRHFEDGDSDIP